MIQQFHIRPRNFFKIPHPDVPGLYVITIIDEVFGSVFDQKVRHHCFDVNVPSPSNLASFAENAEYPHDWKFIDPDKKGHQNKAA